MLSAFGIAAFSRASGAEKLEHLSSISSCLGLVHTMGTSRGGAQHSGHLQGQMDPTAQHSTRMALLAFHGTCKFLHLFPMKGVLALGSGPFYSYQDKPPGSPGSSSSPNSQRTPGSSSAPFPSDPSLPVLPCSPLSLCPPISPSLEPNSYGEKLGDPWVFSLEKGRLGGPHCHALMQPLLEHWVRVWTTQDAKDIKALGSI